MEPLWILLTLLWGWREVPEPELRQSTVSGEGEYRAKDTLPEHRAMGV